MGADATVPPPVRRCLAQLNELRFGDAPDMAEVGAARPRPVDSEDDVNLGPKAKVAYAVARAEEGDKRALAAFEELGRWLGRGLGNLVNLLNPQVVILGGHFIDTSPFVLASAVDELRGDCDERRGERRAGRAVDARLLTVVARGRDPRRRACVRRPDERCLAGRGATRLSARRAGARGRAG